MNGDSNQQIGSLLRISQWLDFAILQLEPGVESREPSVPGGVGKSRPQGIQSGIVVDRTGLAIAVGCFPDPGTRIREVRLY